MKNILLHIPEPVIKALKEAARLAVFTFAAFMVSFGLNYVAELPETQTTLVFTLILRFVDKWLHEAGKEFEDEKFVKGLTRF